MEIAKDNVVDAARDMLRLIESVFADQPDWDDRDELVALQSSLASLDEAYDRRSRASVPSQTAGEEDR